MFSITVLLFSLVMGLLIVGFIAYVAYFVIKKSSQRCIERI